MSAEMGAPPLPVWHERLAPCVAQPGMWLRFEAKNLATANSIASALRRGAVLRPDGDWQFAGRKEHGRAWVFACYQGPHTTATSSTDGSLSSVEACELAGATYRQADYFSRTSGVICSGEGSGSRRRWTPGEVRVLWAYVQLSRSGAAHAARAFVEARADEIKSGECSEIRATNGAVSLVLDMTTCPVEVTT